MASEEEDDDHPTPPEGHQCGRYTIAFDPLDGSSNIDVNVSIGTIFAVHRRLSEGQHGGREGPPPAGPGDRRRRLRDLRQQHDARDHHGQRRPRLHPRPVRRASSCCRTRTSGFPSAGKIYSVNEGNYPYWSEGVKRYVDYIKERDPATGRPYSARYIGSMVADVHRTLLYGGIFMYPKDRKDPEKPGQAPPPLRVRPDGVAHRAGRRRGHHGARAASSTSSRPALHQRVPFFAGSLENVRELERFIEKYNPAPTPTPTPTQA